MLAKTNDREVEYNLVTTGKIKGPYCFLATMLPYSVYNLPQPLSHHFSEYPIILECDTCFITRYLK